jgi:hypothetical protein
MRAMHAHSDTSRFLRGGVHEEMMVTPALRMKYSLILGSAEEDNTDTHSDWSTERVRDLIMRLSGSRV